MSCCEELSGIPTMRKENTYAVPHNQETGTRRLDRDRQRYVRSDDDVVDVLFFLGRRDGRIRGLLLDRMTVDMVCFTRSL